ncbi:amidohydrolase [Metabacillus sp. cB07]|uniref:amidohydrolase n=1 Tax=Metabacillus sp. cB07 TaxID=2806989 RepID=UPI001939F3F6|nr:amidohydrolase [Metabacillus sp. cB07]
MKKTLVKNVMIEKGYAFNELGDVTATKTDMADFILSDGRIEEIVPAGSEVFEDYELFDAEGALALPSFAEMHIHLDKTYYGGKWKAPTKAKSIFTRIEEEQILLLEQLPSVQERAEKLLELQLMNGTGFVRTHCNVDQVVGVKHIDLLQQAFKTYENRLEGEIVAFPQHGLLRSSSVELVKEAMRNGAQFVGGVDPATVDEDIETSLSSMVEIAVEFGAGIDLHLHDRGHLGIYTIKRLLSMLEDAKFKKPVAISHAFGLAALSEGEARELALRFAELGVSLASTVPLDFKMPLALMKAEGVDVYLGNDSITDHWDPFGTGDMLEKANVLSQVNRWKDELALSQSLGYITKGITPLSKEGEQLWPKPGDRADFLLTEASCSAEAIARRTKRKAVFFRGKAVYETE